MSYLLVASLLVVAAASPAVGTEQDPALPQVLLIGDSISIGYTPDVVKMLANEAIVTRVVDEETGNNGRHTRTGLARLDGWLSDGPYDVIHFNWGLWDLCYRHDPDGGRGDKVDGRLTTSTEEYAANLDRLCARLEKTDAALIMATTTPVPAGDPGRFERSAVDYNEVAVLIAAKYGILLDDLHAHMAPRMAEFQTRPNNVHFTDDGYRFLADRVVASIRTVLRRRAHRTVRAGLGRSVQALSGDSARVAFLGGSITHNPGWRDRVGEYLRRRFPETEFDLINAGIPSMGSTPGAFRMGRDVLAGGPVDLLFVEAAVNDESNRRSALEQVRGMEGIVRHALRSNPEMDIVLLHFVDPSKMTVYREGGVPEVIESHESVATRYQLPSLDLAREVTARIDAGEFTWERDFRNLHPSPFGQELYFRSIRDLLAAAWRHAENRADARSERGLRMPHRLDPGCYDHGRLVAVGEASAQVGFKVVASWRPSDGKGTRKGFVDVPMLVGEEPGATVTFRFKGTAVGIFVAAGPDAGRVWVQIDGGEPVDLDLFTRWSAGLHLPFSHILAAGLDDREHVLTLRVAATSNEKSVGNAVRIAHFLVNE